MEAFDGLVTLFPDSKVLLNKSFASEFDRLPTIDHVIKGTLIDPNDESGILPYPSILNLYEGGCRSLNVEGDHTVNCTKACGDANSLFWDWQTQWNCLTLANMALNQPHPHKYNSSHTTGDTAKILNSLQVINLTAFDGASVFQMYRTCAVASVNQSSGDGLGFGNITSSLNLSEWGRNISAICKNPVLTIDSDLAGPGVICSYLMLIAISLYSWACIRFLYIARSINWWAKLIGRKGNIYSFITFQRSRFAKRIEHSTIVLIVEMQEAQCFFILAIQVGLFLANRHSTTSFDLTRTTWQTTLYNRSVMKGLTEIALMAIMLHQIILCKIQLDSVYLLLLCTVVFAISYVNSTASVLDGIDFDVIYQSVRKFDGFSSCGSITDLKSLCSSDPYYKVTGIEPLPSLLKTCLAVLVLLWFKEAWRELAGNLWLMNYAESASKKGPLILLYVAQLGYLIMTGFIVFSEFFFILWMAEHLEPLRALWSNKYSSPFVVEGFYPEVPVNNNLWSIGQIIAVLVWAPVISKYIYLLMFGIECQGSKEGRGTTEPQSRSVPPMSPLGD